MNDFRKSVVLCPAFLKQKWEYEVRRWTKKEPFVVNGKQPYKLPRTGIIIINYDILQYHLDELEKTRIGCVLADEVHLCKNPSTKRTKAFIDLSHHAERVIGLTATPIINNPMDIYTILSILDKRFWSRQVFENKYCIKKEDRITGGKNLDELYKMITDSTMIRKRLEEVKSEMDGFDTQVIQDFIPFKLKDYSEYNRAFEDIVAYLDYKKSEKVAMLQRTKILCDIIFENKYEQIFEWVDNFLLSSEKIALFFQYTEHLKLFAERYNAVVINGDVSAKKRFDITDKFNKDGSQVLCANIQAVGVGLDITGCSNCAFVDLPFNYTNISQGFGRFARYGQKSPFVNVYYLVGMGTIEENYRLDKIDVKTDIASQIVDGVHLIDKDSMRHLHG